MNEWGMCEGNLLIRASAGTGKTFALATRFIRLMLFDKVEPSRIVALTFSRAAAQEIYTKILSRLWKAAYDQDGADEEKKRLLDKLPEETVARINTLHIVWTPATFAALLRKVVAAQHLGVIATLDSFILRLVGNFPLEMGFQHAVSVLDEFGEKNEMDRAKKALLARSDDAGVFAEAFRAAKEGALSRTCAQTLDSMMNTGWRAFILTHPESQGWKEASMADALGIQESDANTLETATVGDDIADKNGRTWFGKFKDYLGKVKAGANPLPSGKKSIPLEFAQAVAEHPNAPYVVHVTSKGEEERCAFPESVFAAAHRDLVRLANAYFRRQLAVIAAKIRLFAIIEREYDLRTRQMGKLTFQDFTDAAKDNSKIELENLRFRFDAKLDHWALDEFQDTSEVQWKCLHDLVLSAAEGGSSSSRSVIAVGDLKQSIYTWRGGDDKPFEEMMGWLWFNKDEKNVYGRIEDAKTSYRYGKHIADFINRVFGPKNIRDGGLIPVARQAAIDRWLKADCWLEHVPEYDEKTGLPKVQDYVKVVRVTADDAQEHEEALVEALGLEVAAAWKAREAVGSDEEIGVLVRKNEYGVLVAEALRKKGLPVVWEGLNGVGDVPVVQAILALLQLSEHPEDAYAWKVVNDLLPVRKILLGAFNTPAAVSAHVAERLSHQGLARTLKDFCNVLGRDEHGLDVLSRTRLQSLVRLGVDYEARREEDGMEGFVRYVEEAARRESASSSNVIRILTIHRSKGLTLDRVYVPLFEGKKSSIAELQQGCLLFGTKRGWVFPYVAGDVLLLNEETRAAFTAQCDARLLEHLRLYYVALTRARKALTVLFSQKDENHKGLFFCDLIEKAVASFEPRACEAGTILFEDGDEPAFKAAEKKADDAPMPGDWSHPEAEARVKRCSPSRLAHAEKSNTSPLTADVLFAEGYGASARHGVDVHAEYAKIEWADAKAAESLSEAFRTAFVRPSVGATVWRERPYELCRDGVWESGQFDRVVFVGAGTARSATIYDFKTNAREASESEAAFGERMRALYTSQMTAYRRALCSLTGIPEERIATVLLLTATGQALTI